MPHDRGQGDEGRRWAVIAGGGTTGHVAPAIAVADALVAVGCPPEAIQFVGSERAIESELVPSAGYQISLYPGRGIVRRLALRNVAAGVGVVIALARCIAAFRRWRPQVVVSVGGYASVPAVVAARVWRVPLVLVAHDSVPGAAHRLGARWASATAAAFPGTTLPHVTVTGSPVRAAVRDVARDEVGQKVARELLHLDADRFVIAVFGGSLGARRINEAVLEFSNVHADSSDLGIYHVVGRRDFAYLAKPKSGALQYVSVPYEQHMELVYAAADLAICRAGASTIAELSIVGLPSILVPLPNAPGDHQTHNARALSNASAAVLLPDGECTASRLDVLVEEFRVPSKLNAMKAALAGLAKPRAADDIASLVRATANNPWTPRATNDKSANDNSANDDSI